MVLVEHSIQLEVTQDSISVVYSMPYDVSRVEVTISMQVSTEVYVAVYVIGLVKMAVVQDEVEFCPVTRLLC